MKSWKTKTAYGLLLVLMMACAGRIAFVYYGLDEYCQAIKALHVRKIKARNYEKKNFFAKYDNKIIQLIKTQKSLPQDEVVSFCRKFIYFNSRKQYDESYKENISKMYAIIENSLSGESDNISLKCDGRAYLLRNMLYNIGIESRLVHGLYVGDNNEVIGHTFLEVNENGSWVVQDSYFNLSFVNKETGSPASLIALCMNEINSFAVTMDSSAEEFSAQHDYFSKIYSIVIYDNRETGKKNLVIFNKRKLGISVMRKFFNDAKYEAIRRYLIKKWYDYEYIDM